MREIYSIKYLLNVVGCAHIILV